MGAVERCIGGEKVPLSEDEERILSQIEEQLYASDPDLVRSVGERTDASHPRRTALVACLGIVVGLVLTVALLSVNAALAFVCGFGLMLVSAVRLESVLRWQWRETLRSAASVVRTFGLRETTADDTEDSDDDF